MASFVERHKLWVLPLLGVGVAAVVILNFRSSSSPTPPAEPPAPVEAVVGTAPAAEPAAAGTDLWADLKALETVPPSLAQDGALSLRAHAALGKAMDPPPLPELAQPRSAPAEPRKAVAVLEPVAPVPPPPPPEPDFVFQGPRGRRVWIEGRPLAEGQGVPEGPYRIGRIGRSRVELIGPQGSTSHSTIPTRPIPKPPQEQP